MEPSAPSRRSPRTTGSRVVRNLGNPGHVASYAFSRSPLLLGVALLSWANPNMAEVTPPPAETAHLEAVFGGFYQVGLDLDHPLQVENLVVKKDALEFTMKRGTLYLTRPFEGEVTGAFFSGEGSMAVSLPNATERRSLKRWTGKETFVEPITVAVLRFDDGTDKILSESAKPGGAAVKDARAAWETRSKVDYNTGSFQLDFLESRLGGIKERDFLYVEAKTQGGQWVYLATSQGSAWRTSSWERSPVGPRGSGCTSRGAAFTRKATTTRRETTTSCPRPTTRAWRLCGTWR